MSYTKCSKDMTQLKNKLLWLKKIDKCALQNMLKNHRLAKAISDVSWSEFERILDYKAEWYGRNIVKIDTFSHPVSYVVNVLTKTLKLKI